MTIFILLQFSDAAEATADTGKAPIVFATDDWDKNGNNTASQAGAGLLTLLLTIAAAIWEERENLVLYSFNKFLD